VREDSDGVHIKTIYPENKFRAGASEATRRFRSITISPCRLTLRYGCATHSETPKFSGVRGWSQIENANGSLTVRDARRGKDSERIWANRSKRRGRQLRYYQQQRSGEVSEITGKLEIRNRSAKSRFQGQRRRRHQRRQWRHNPFQCRRNFTINNSFGEVTAAMSPVKFRSITATAELKHGCNQQRHTQHQLRRG